MGQKSRKNFVVCVGSTKSGTSWLHNQLRYHPQFYLRSIKEYHYFGNSMPHHWTKNADRLRIEIQTLSERQSELPTIERAERISDLAQYLRVLELASIQPSEFSSFLVGAESGSTFFGDFTPAYSILKGDQLKKIRHLDGKLRILYLMRDPVERFWSHAKMAASVEGKANVIESANQIAVDFLLNKESRQLSGILKRGDYPSNLPKLERIFGKNSLIPFFYEEMVTADGFASLMRHIGAAPFEPNFSSRTHAGTQGALPDYLRQELSDKFQAHYDFVYNYMGYLPETWTHHNNEKYC